MPLTERDRTTKRPNGSGSVYPFGNRWRVAVPYRDRATGRTKYRVRIASTRREGERLLAVTVRERDAGLDLSTVTVAAFLHIWLEGQRRRVRESTFVAYELRVRRHVVPSLGRRVLAELTERDVEGLMGRMVSEGWSPMTARHVRSTLRKALGTAVRDGLVPRNVAVSVELPRLKHRPVVALTREEAALLIETCEGAGTSLGDLVIIAVTTGMRQGELLGLSWQDAHPDDPNPWLEVTHALTRSTSGGWVVGETKTRQSRRRIELPLIAAAALRRQRLRQKEGRMRAGSAWRDTGLVFTNEVGEHLAGWTASSGFHALAARAGVRRCRFHDLRHTAASLWLQAGVNLQTVSEALGHTSIAITADVYGKVSPVQRRELADVMTRLSSPN